MPPPEFLRGHAGAFAELLGEGALIAEGVIEGDLDDGERGFGQGFGGGLDAGAQQELVGADVEGDAELAMQVALRNAGGAGELGGGDDFVAVLAGVLHGDGDLAHVVLAHAVLVAAGDAHDTDDPAAFVAHGQLRAEEPAQVPLLVIPDFEAVDERFAAADDFLVVVAICLGHIRREEFLIHRADELALALDAKTLKGGAVRRDVPPLVVLHEKEHAGHVLENRPHALRIGDPGEKVSLEAWQRHGRIVMQKNRLSQGKHGLHDPPVTAKVQAGSAA